MIAKIALAFMLFSILCGGPAGAKCGTGNTASYRDISAVMFTQNGCNSTIQDAYMATLKTSEFPRGRLVSAFDCSTFWVLFWNNGLKDVPTTYSQYNLKHAVGTFELAATLDDVRAVLDQDHFYDLNPGNLTITDAARAVLSVNRCGVTTRIAQYNVQGSSVARDAPTVRLFDDLRALIARAREKRTSFAPTDFEQTLLFDP